MIIQSLILAAALAQAPVTGTGSDLNQGDVAPQTDGGAPEAKKPGPDVSKMPFTPYSIQQVVKFHLPEIQKCYEQVVLEIGGAPPEGRVVVNFTIMPNGLTSQTKIDRKKTSIKNDRIHDCVTDGVRMWEFPKPSDNREHPIEYPFDLKVQQEPGGAAKKDAAKADAGSAKTDASTAKPTKASKKKAKKK